MTALLADADLTSLLGGAGAVRALFDASPDLMTIAPIDGPPIYINPAARRVLGIGATEEVDTLLDHRPPGFARYLRDVILAGIEQHGSWSGETDYVTRAGGLIRVSQVSVAWDAGDAVYLSSVSRDIGTQKLAQEGLRRAEERTRFALEAARAGVWEADLRSGRVVWSETMRAVQGFSGEEFAGTLDSFLALVHPADRSAVSGAMATATERPGDFNVEFRTLWPDGTTHWVESHGRVMTDAAGRPARLLAMAQDVTERRELEAQLQEAQKIEAIGQLAGGLAHDFNNLLTVIIGYSRLLEDDLPDNDPHRPDIGEIRKAGERAARLTGQLLAFSRRQVLQPVALDLNELIESLSLMLGRVMGEHIQLDLRLRRGGAIVEADRGQLEQVLVNLCVNARDAMPRGGRLSIATSTVHIQSPIDARHLALAPGAHVLLAVADNGTGMDETTKHRIFEPFFTTKARGKGTGLGLATVFGVVKQSGGAIDVETQPGRGSTFRLYFPVRAGVPAVGAEAAVEARAVHGGETILLVEDEDGVRALSSTILERSGYRVIAAGHALAALDAQKSIDRVDLLLTDVVMPGMGGAELFERLSRGRPGLRAVFMSGFSGDAIEGHGVLDRRVPLLQKPFTAPDLLTAVRGALDHDPPAGAAS